MGDGGRDFHNYSADGGQGRRGGQDMNVWQIDHRERAKRQRMFWVTDRGDEVYQARDKPWKSRMKQV